MGVSNVTFEPLEKKAIMREMTSSCGIGLSIVNIFFVVLNVIKMYLSFI